MKSIATNPKQTMTDYPTFEQIKAAIQRVQERTGCDGITFGTTVHYFAPTKKADLSYIVSTQDGSGWGRSIDVAVDELLKDLDLETRIAAKMAELEALKKRAAKEAK